MMANPKGSLGVPKETFRDAAAVAVASWHP